MPNAKPKIVLYWHRTDLRLHDSPALQAALSLNPTTFIPIWTWDPHYVYKSRVGPNRWSFLLESQKTLSNSYSKLNPRQQLWLIREAPQSKDEDAYARERDGVVVKLAEEAGVEVIVKSGRTLFDVDEIVRKNGGKPTMSMAQIQKAVEKIGSGVPERPIDAPTSIPDPLTRDEMDLKGVKHDGGGGGGGMGSESNSGTDMNADHRSTTDKQYAGIMGPGNDFGVPTLEEIGINPAEVQTPHRGGETVALELLAGYIEDEEYIGRFEKPNTSPAAFEPQSTTLLSPHLHFGTLSVRKFWWDVQDVMERRKKEKKSNASIPTNLPGQLLFREMYFAAHAAVGESFCRTYGNPMVRFIDWHLQSKSPEDIAHGEEGGKLYEVDSDEAEVWFLRWKEGRTGFPWIDALMRQLKQEGWIHHLGRHSVACFLTRGGCYVSWERGAEVFEEMLIDHETACNIGNWMWLSCTAFFSQFYRCYSPIAFGKKWDPEGNLIRRYCPELAKFDKKYIYEPWRAPIANQRKWACRVTGDGSSSTNEDGKIYPKPMFDFDERRTICLDAMKNAYHVGLHGNDKELKDGSWRKAFGLDEDGKRPKKKQKT
ncbi:DNA photolyase [Penicillium waksmanii]|uniref:DNA photolyase n=1 Tax=Penicillium waksmanii TaxID=69791 RepID=UPI002546949A|nr:DNA photolyase [Penicillium waksmanii]KAJ5984135.1 DNA photolyase [Penicillium waksmanii]